MSERDRCFVSECECVSVCEREVLCVCVYGALCAQRVIVGHM